MSADDRPTIRVPGDLAVEDRVAGQLTFRHLGYLAVAGGGAALALLGTAPAARVAGVLLALAGLAGAVVRPSGRPLDAWLLPALRYWRRSRADRAPDVVDAPDVPDVVEPPVTPDVPPPPSRVRSAVRVVPRLAAGMVAVAVGALAVAGGMRLLPVRSQPPPQQPVWLVPVAPPSEEEVQDAIEAYVEWLLRND